MPDEPNEPLSGEALLDLYRRLLEEREQTQFSDPLGNYRQVWNGRPYTYSEPSDHWEHVHFRMSKGGVIGSGEGVRYRLGPDECLLRPETMKCGRAGHPTATSDCAKPPNSP